MNDDAAGFGNLDLAHLYPRFGDCLDRSSQIGLSKDQSTHRADGGPTDSEEPPRSPGSPKNRGVFMPTLGFRLIYRTDLTL